MKIDQVKDPVQTLESVMPYWKSLLIIFASIVSCTQHCSAQKTVKFKIKKLMQDANEGVDIADFNRDGKPDVVAGRFWYAAPDFIPRPIRQIKDWNGYVESNGDFAHDVNRDGRPDVIAGGFIPTQVHWYENPGPKELERGKMWKQHLLVDTKQSQNEISFLEDLDGDGQVEWITNSWNGRNPILVWRFTQDKKPVKVSRFLLGDKGQGHGMGFGDINGDGRKDVLTATGWYEQPESPWKKPWTFHADWNWPQASCPILVRDLNGDGVNDIVWGKGHDFGLYWMEQTTVSERDPEAPGKLAFRQHLIDKRFSQAHAIHLADLDGDGTDELITGKRVFAHNGNDPGGKQMPCMYYYKWDLDRKMFDRHLIDEGHVGTGLQIRTGDLNGDKRTDIVVAGKDGTWLLFNQGTDSKGGESKERLSISESDKESK